MSLDVGDSRLPLEYQLARQIIEAAYHSCADQAPSTADVMNAYDRFAGSLLVTQKKRPKTYRCGRA